MLLLSRLRNCAMFDANHLNYNDKEVASSRITRMMAKMAN